jgi:prepilin peptidase CpaA
VKIRPEPALEAAFALASHPFGDLEMVVPPSRFPSYYWLDKVPWAVYSMRMVKEGVWIVAALFAAAAGWTDCRSRRIPNWLTMTGLALGIAMNTLAWGWTGTKASLLGAVLGLALLLPFVLVKSLGAGDWKLVGALGAFLGPGHLIAVLLVTILVAGVMAVALIVWKKRVRQTFRNLGHMLAAFFSLHLPGPELSLDNPESLKVPFGVAVAVAVILYTARQAWGVS